MSYATTNDLALRLGATVYGEIYLEETEALNDLAAAQAEIDGNLACRYETPVTAEGVQELLKDWNLTLAEERAAARPVGAQFTEKVKLRVEQVRKYLEMIRGGTFKLAGVEESDAGVFTLYEAEEPVFGRENLKGF